MVYTVSNSDALLYGKATIIQILGWLQQIFQVSDYLEVLQK